MDAENDKLKDKLPQDSDETSERIPYSYDQGRFIGPHEQQLAPKQAFDEHAFLLRAAARVRARKARDKAERSHDNDPGRELGR
ncbi:hypothetical protein [Seohaeicola zhoushanensis]|uniref:Uncharacterized protein n=1 Tax=Seohaeicola zhoushanensis TaxID=1569283 RepID=A0A8J3H2V7_9RHOB|nr:hypothetical protein [Seohaeicola zhoushanensis]GHF70145.1 hypothetical protein GCM10017056_46490 [Seohaeicola zhoushanensis]